MKESGDIYYKTYNKRKSLFAFLPIKINKLYFICWGSLAEQAAAL